MEIKVDNKSIKDYIFKPNKVEEIEQNIENIISRVKQNVVLGRHKGIETEIIDSMPRDYTAALIRTGIISEIEREEKRYKVHKIIVECKDNNFEHIQVILKGEIIDA